MNLLIFRNYLDHDRQTSTNVFSQNVTRPITSVFSTKDTQNIICQIPIFGIQSKLGICCCKLKLTEWASFAKAAKKLKYKYPKKVFLL